MKQIALFISLWLSLWSCTPNENKEKPKIDYQTTGSIERKDPEIDKIIPSDAEIEILATGFGWSEGPVWLPAQNALIFSDVVKNIVYRWSETDSITEYLNPSGYSGDRNDKHEPGSNGLILDNQGRLVLCQHGDRQIARMMASLDAPDEIYEPIVKDYNGLRLNSPNDITINSKGTFYFTDPPYGLDEWNIKELDFQGVYKMDQQGNLSLQIDTLTRPNGIGLSPDEKTLYIAVSDPECAGYFAYDLDENGNVAGGHMILDAKPFYSASRSGNPDGMYVSKSGYLFATGPGGVFVFNPAGHHIGTILTGEKTANCTMNEDESVLYMTADSYLMRIKLKS